jgi:hypothetical protein
MAEQIPTTNKSLGKYFIYAIIFFLAIIGVLSIKNYIDEENFKNFEHNTKLNIADFFSQDKNYQDIKVIDLALFKKNENLYEGLLKIAINNNYLNVEVEVITYKNRSKWEISAEEMRRLNIFIYDVKNKTNF